MRRVWLATVPSLCPSFVQWFNAFVDWVVISWELLWTLLIWLASPCRRASRRKRAISKLYITGLLSSYNLGHKGWKEIILYTFCSSPPLCNVDKNFSSNTSLHFTIFQHWKGEWGFWHLFCRYYDYNFMFLAFSNTICDLESENGH